MVVNNIGNWTSNGITMGESLNLFEVNASTRIISASTANGGYFTPCQSR
ncbi:hypothetical protein AAZX31_03G097800 [Glycine max]